MIRRDEWDRMSDNDKFDYVVYIAGQLEGMIKAARLNSYPTRKENTPEETKTARHPESVDQWLTQFQNGD